MGLYTTNTNAHEVLNTQREDYDADNGSANAAVTLIVPAADRYIIVSEILANAYVWPHGANPAIASKIGIVPAPNSNATEVNGTLLYDFYHLNIAYTTKKPEGGQTTDGDGNVYSEELVPLTEHQTLDYNDYEWDNSNPLKEGEAPTKIVRSFNYVRTIFNLQPPLSGSLLDAPGCVNNAAFLSPSLGMFFPAESLLFGDPKISRQYSLTTGFSGITLQTSFAFRKDGWNKFWRAKTNAWAEIKKKSDGAVVKPYPPIDFSFLLF